MFRFSTKFDKKSKVWSGIESAEIFNNNLTVSHVLFYLTNNSPDKVIQISDDSGVSLTNNDIRVRSIQAARFYQKVGLKQGDVIGFVAKNSENLMPTVLGAFLCGIVVNGLFPSFGKEDLKSCFIETKPKLIFCDDGNYDLIKLILTEIGLQPPVYTINKKIENVSHVTDFILEGMDNSADNFEYPTISNSKNIPAIIMYSSGTTGRPKGICVSHATLIRCAYHILSSTITSDDILFAFTTLNGISSFSLTLRGWMRGATKIITTEGYTPEVLVKIVKKYNVSVMYTPPSHMAILLHYLNQKQLNIPSLRLYLTGGGLVNQHLVNELKSILPQCSVRNTYGLTETGTIASTENINKSGCVGKVAANVNIKIVNNNGETVEGGIYGEIFAKPPSPFLGYYGKPQETKEVYDEEGWFHTGDIGYFDEDKDLIIVNRKNDMLNYKGFQYFPSEIEDIIMEMPEVNQVCVAGVPDAQGDLLPTALIVVKAKTELCKEKVLDYTRQRLEDYKHLKGGVFFVDSLPISYGGKYKRDIVQTIATKLFNQQLQAS